MLFAWTEQTSSRTDEQAALKGITQKSKVLSDTQLNESNILRKEIEVLKAEEKAALDEKKELIPFSYFGIPYFKDAAYNTPPLNDDALKAKELGFRNISLLMNNNPSKFLLRMRNIWQ